MITLTMFTKFRCEIFIKISVAVFEIYRHGDRTPLQTYPNDPYSNLSYWPDGLGQLTKEGKQRHFLLGKWLRNRYQSFLSDKYSSKDVYVRSDDTDRTIMSAACNLAGLYPPKAKQVWNKDLPWQPIPVHNIPQSEDAVVAMKKPCPKYDVLYKQLMKSDYFRNVTKHNKKLFGYLTEKAGEKIGGIKDVKKLYTTLSIEEANNLTLPQWTELVFPDKLRGLAELSFASNAFTKNLARLRVGPFFATIIDFFDEVANAGNKRKMLIFSGHDKNIVEILAGLGALKYHCPPFASTLIFELRKLDGQFYVEVFYKKLEELEKVTVKGCVFECKLEDFRRILEPVTAGLDEWLVECNQ